MKHIQVHGSLLNIMQAAATDIEQLTRQLAEAKAELEYIKTGNDAEIESEVTYALCQDEAYLNLKHLVCLHTVEGESP